MEKTGELVSIIVPVYNAGSYIEETIRMVLAQTFPHWELILVDDCSSDDSREKIRACIKDAGEDVKDTVEDVGKDVGKTVEDVGKNTGNAVEDIAK